MALFDTDWTKELEQVHSMAKKIIDDDMSPMIDRKIDLINKHADELIRETAYQADKLAKEIVNEIEVQRKKLVIDLIKIGLILLIGFTSCTAALIWLFFFLKDGAHF